MHSFFACASLSAYVAIALRIFFYRRGGANHRAHVSWIAWMLLALVGGYAIELAVHPRPVGFFEAASGVVLAFIVHCARGNVARLLWSIGK